VETEFSLCNTNTSPCAKDEDPESVLDFDQLDSLRDAGTHEEKHRLGSNCIPLLDQPEEADTSKKLARAWGSLCRLTRLLVQQYHR
jgi:hypothetical protein